MTNNKYWHPIHPEVVHVCVEKNLHEGNQHAEDQININHLYIRCRGQTVAELKIVLSNFKCLRSSFNINDTDSYVYEERCQD